MDVTWRLGYAGVDGLSAFRNQTFYHAGNGMADPTRGK
jgi:hypothetical protein